MIQQYLDQYWGVAVILVAALIYIPTHYKASVSFARKIALQFIFAAEKRAEELLLATGQQKLDWVVDKGYDLMPAPVRLIISKPLFRLIVQSVYDAAMAFAKKHQIVQEQQNVSAPVASIQQGDPPV